MQTHPLDDPEMSRLLRDLDDAATVAEWNQSVADLLHALLICAQGGRTPPERRSLVFGLVGKVAKGFAGKAHRPRSVLRARRDGLLIFGTLFPEGHNHIDAGEAARRLMHHENEGRRSRAQLLGLPLRADALVQIGQARSRIRKAMELFGVSLPPGMPGFRSKRGR